LRRELADGARKPAQDVRRQATAAGITPKALRSAKEALGIKPEKDGFDGGWVWALPKMPNTPEGAHFQKRASSAPEGIFGGGKDAPPAVAPPGDSLDDFDGGR